MSEMFETNNARWIPDVADHCLDLFFPARIIVVAGWSQADDMPALRTYLAGIEE
jgi:hypothetical protein